MREIKFRAWHKELNKFIGKHVKGLFLTFDGQLRYGGKDMQEKVVLQQYTGLHDRNGKEICEGDIVRVIALPVSAIEENMVVKYDGEKGAFILQGDSFGFSLRQARSGSIIGNIYTNPELLEEQRG